MANWDDKERLINYLRNGFSTAEGASACERILKPYVKIEKPGYCRVVAKSAINCQSQSFDSLDNEFDDDLGEPAWSSPPERNFMSRGIGRRRQSETDKRLVELSKRLRSKEKTVTVLVKAPDAIPKPSAALLSQFQKKEIPDPSQVCRVSALSKIVDELPSAPVNPFQEFSQFDSTGFNEKNIKQLNVYCPSVINNNADIGQDCISIGVDDSISVKNVVGLVCYSYHKLGFKPDLVADAGQYQLSSIIVDDGETFDDELACVMDNFTTIGDIDFNKFVFAKAGSRSPTDLQSERDVAVFFDTHDVHWVKVKDFANTHVNVVKTEALKLHFAGHAVPFYLQMFDYNIEPLSKHGEAIDCDNKQMMLSQFPEAKFYMVREHSSRGDLHGEVPGISVVHQSGTISVPPSPSRNSNNSANNSQGTPTGSLKGLASSQVTDSDPVCYFYKVHMLQKMQMMRMSDEVVLNICRDCIQVVSSKSRLLNASASKFLHPMQNKRQNSTAVQTLTISMELVGGSEVATSEKSSGRQQFRILHMANTTSNDWKPLLFETDANTCAQILKNLNYFIDNIGPSDVRKRYLNQSANKPAVRRSTLLKKFSTEKYTGV